MVDSKFHIYFSNVLLMALLVLYRALDVTLAMTEYLKFVYIVPKDINIKVLIF